MALAAFLLLGAGASAQQNLQLQTVIGRLHSYLREYAIKLPATIATERYEQRCGRPGIVPPTTRVVLVSEFGIMRMTSPAGWLGLRDVQSVNDRPLENSGQRLQELFRNPSAHGIAQARKIALENARFNVGPIQRTINDPAVVLTLLDSSNAERMRFTKAGDAASDDAGAWIIKFRERERPTVIQTSDGRDQPVQGTAWVDPLTGRLLRAEVTIDAAADRRGLANRMGFTATIGVTFEADPKLGFWVPSKMTERYSSLDLVPCAGDATYTDYRTFGVQTRIIPP